MAWLELHTVLVRHRKTKKLARDLGILPVYAVGHLIILWSNVLELAEDGNITKWSIEDIADYAEWIDDAQTFYNAMVNGTDGWIDEHDGKRMIHDWWDYTGRYLKAKYKTSDPNKLHQIEAMYKDADGLQSVCSSPTYLPNLPNLPNNNVHFEELWAKYPNRVGKKMAKRSYQASVKRADDKEKIETALKNYVGSKKVREGFVQNGSTWFANWQDWVVLPDAKGAESWMDECIKTQERK